MYAKVRRSTHSKFEAPSNVKSFQFDPITPEKVFQELLQLKSFKVCGPKNIPIKLIQINSPINSSSSQCNDNFNKCFEAGISPAVLKKAKVIPIFKLGQKDFTSNYRPITILSRIAKIFEKLLPVHVRIENYFSSLKIISSQQFGFRKSFFTEIWP